MASVNTRDIRITEKRSSYDAACKRLLSNKIYLAWLLKYCVKDYADIPIKEIAENYIEDVDRATIGVDPDETNLPDTSGKLVGATNEDTSLNEGRITYDIRFYAKTPGKTGETSEIIVNVEAQNRFKPKYPLIKRALYYCSRMISAQNGVDFTGSDYGKIKRVYSIWLCTEPDEEWKNNIGEYSITEKKYYGDAKLNPEDYQLLTVVMICLGDEAAIQKLETEYKPLLGLFELLFNKSKMSDEKIQTMTNDYDIEFTDPMKEETKSMCDLSQGIWDESTEKTLTKAIQTLMENTKWSVEEAMKMIGVPEDEYAKYASKIAELQTV